MDYKETLDCLDRMLDKQFKYKNVDDVYKELQEIKSSLKTCRNELCLHCGKYKDYKGFDYCSDCRWKGE